MPVTGRVSASLSFFWFKRKVNTGKKDHQEEREETNGFVAEVDVISYLGVDVSSSCARDTLAEHLVVGRNVLFLLEDHLNVSDRATGLCCCCWSSRQFRGPE